MGRHSDAFSYQATKDGKVFISRQGKRIAVLKGAKAAAFLESVDDADEDLSQLEMARVTGNYKRGNERLMGERRRERQ